MPTFTYKAWDDQGRSISGKMDVSSQKELQARLENCGFFLVESVMQSKSILEEDIFKKFITVTRKNIYSFTLQLGNTYSTGVPVLHSFSAIIETTKNVKLIEILTSMREYLKSGGSLSQAMQKHPNIFSRFYTSMVELGEASGSLPKILSSLASQLKKEMETRNKVISAMIYPAAVTVIAIGVVTYLLVYIMPQFVEIFKEQEATLPLPTQILLALSYFVRRSWYLILGFVVAVIVAYRQYARSDSGRLTIDQIKLKIPIVGNVLKKIYVKRFIDGLYLLYSSGLPIIAALNIVRSLIGNRELENTVGALTVHMSTGKELTTYLSLTDFFPADILSMIRSAEDSGRLQETLIKISEIYDDEVNNGIDRLVQTFEIGILVTMGSGIGFIAMAIMFPLFRLSQAVLG